MAEKGFAAGTEDEAERSVSVTGLDSLSSKASLKMRSMLEEIR